MRYQSRYRSRPPILAVCLLYFAFGAVSRLTGADFVWLITIDGLRPSDVEQLGAEELPNIDRLMREGVWTHNARTDFYSTFTVPNHLSMITGRPVQGPDGHQYAFNGSPSTSATVHAGADRYIPSVFDVAHDHGFTTAVYCGKDKLDIILQTWYGDAAAEDEVGEDNGRDKLDRYYRYYDFTAEVLMDVFEEEIREDHYQALLLHLTDPDPVGHNYGWGSPTYHEAVKQSDAYLGRIFDLIEEVPEFRDRVTLIVTSDHGGVQGVHRYVDLPIIYTIPFYVWGADVPESGDLYEMNTTSRSEPGTSRPEYETEEPQPIRNGDAANLMLDLLGLPPVDGGDAPINAAQDLNVARVLAPEDFRVIDVEQHDDGWSLSWTSLGEGVTYRIESSPTGDSDSWETLAGFDELKHTLQARIPLGSEKSRRFFRVRADFGEL